MDKNQQDLSGGQVINIKERLWTGYDKWGDNDKDRTTEDKFVLNQTEDIPSYIRTFNQIFNS